MITNKRRTLVEKKNTGQKKVVYDNIFFETLKVVTIVKSFHINKGERREKKSKI